MKGDSSQPPRIRGFVFLAIIRERGLVYAGYSTEPRAALRKLQTANPYEIAMTLVIPGTEHTYRALVAKLAGCHVANGWYRARAVANVLLGIGCFQDAIEGPGNP